VAADAPAPFIVFISPIIIIIIIIVMVVYYELTKRNWTLKAGKESKIRTSTCLYAIVWLQNYVRLENHVLTEPKILS